MRGDISVSVSTGIEKTHFALTNDDNLLIVHEYLPKLAHTIHLGRCTVANIQGLQDCLERLKIHAVAD